jgi:hypothetical protein
MQTSRQAQLAKEGIQMANQNGRNSSMSDDDRMSWRPQDDESMSSRNRRDDEERMYGRDRDDRYGRSWEDRSERSSRSIDRGGQGQSGYGAGSTGYDDRFSSSRGRFDNNGNYLAQGGQQMGRDQWGNEMGHREDRDIGGSHYRSGYEGRGQGGFGGSGETRNWREHEDYAARGFGGMPGRGMTGGSTQGQHPQGMQGYGQQGWSGQNEYGHTGQWGGSYGQPSWNTGSAGMNMGQPGVGGSYNQGYQGSMHGYIGADRPFSHHYGTQQGHGQSNFAHQGYSHLGQQNFGHLGPQSGAHMSGGGMYQQGHYGQGPQRWGNEGYQQGQGEHESLGQRIKGWFQGHRGKGPMGYARSDERIRETVCEALSDDDRVDASNIEVTVKNGEVILTGTVEDRQSKRMAEDCVENLSGVKDVQNQIRVVQPTMSSSQSTMNRGSSLSQNVDLSTTGSGTSVNQNGTDKRHKA